MTEEERQKLVASLRIYERIGGLGPMCGNAADEIEQLTTEVKTLKEIRAIGAEPEGKQMRSDLSVDQAALAHFYSDSEIAAFRQQAKENAELAMKLEADTSPDPTKVICPNCAHQFGAISVADQERLRAQSNAEPVAWPDIDAAVKAGLAWRNPAPNAAPSAHSNVKTVTIGGAQSDAEQFKQCPICGKDEDHEHNDAEVGAWLKTQPDAEPAFTPESDRRVAQEFAEHFPKAATVQSDAEPVAWLLLNRDGEQIGVDLIKTEYSLNYGITVEPLYAAPPRPNASAGLIEAAEMAEEYASKYCYDSQAEQGLLRNFAKVLRSRAADRNGKNGT